MVPIQWNLQIPTPVFLPGESQGRGSLVGCRLWGHTESGTTEATQQQQQQHGDKWLGNESVVKREKKIATFPTGNQAVPTTEPDWDYNTAKGRWDQSHFVRCILEGRILSKRVLRL